MAVIITSISKQDNNDRCLELHLAIASRQHNEVKRLLASGADVHQPDTDDCLPLEKAVALEDLKTVQFLLRAGADPNRGSSPPLLEAVYRGSYELVAALVDAGADINLRLEDDETILMNASSSGDLEIVKLLVEAGANAKVVSKQGDSALTLAAANGWQEIFDYLSRFATQKEKRAASKLLTAGLLARQRQQDPLVSKLVDSAGAGNVSGVNEAIAAGVNVDAIGEAGCTALYIASYWGHTEVIKTLIAAEANLEIEHQEEGLSPLLGSVKMAASSSVYLLLHAGANPNARSRNGVFTPLIMAASQYVVDKSTIQLLINSGADINARNKYGSTALMTAAYVDGRSSIFSQTAVVKALLEAGASLEELSEIDLILASWKGDREQVLGLIQNDVNVNARTYNGETALVHAVEKGYTQIVCDLVEAGADVDACGLWTPLTLAFVDGYAEIAQLLLDAGADAAAKNANGTTALQVKTSSKEIRSLIKRIRSTRSLRVDAEQV